MPLGTGNSLIQMPSINPLHKQRTDNKVWLEVKQYGNDSIRIDWAPQSLTANNRDTIGLY